MTVKDGKPKMFATDRTEAFLDLVDFVEGHGGSIGGETRDELWRLVNRFAWCTTVKQASDGLTSVYLKS
jgi:hypothetical protein